MMNSEFFFAACLLLLLINVARVECRGVAAGVAKSDPKGGGRSERQYKLFVFGDSYADTGNSPDNGQDRWSRQWYYPYGISDTHHDKKPAGRYSNGMIQSDYLARILGYDESPPAYMLKGSDGIDSGMNFANKSASNLLGSRHRNLATQLEQFDDLIVDRHISERDLKHSVALVAYSGNDYEGVDANQIGEEDLDDMIGKVTQGIAEVVRELLGMGVHKVLMNSMPPLGCQPWSLRVYNNSQCDDGFNALSDKHNAALLDKLRQDKDVLLLDINAMFTEIIIPKEGSTLSKQFENTASPCCESFDTNDGYCGQTDDNGEQQFTVCDNPERYFYWDDMHPTQAGWKAVTQLLQGPIMAFLGISNLNHL